MGIKISKAERKEAALGPTLYNTIQFDGEAERLASLQACCVLHTPREPRFDVFGRLAATIFSTPVALISLIEDRQLWFKTVAGPFGSCVDREGSFCSYIVVPDHAEVLIVENATEDARFAENAFVLGPPGIRFYAGVPLVGSGGQRWGTMCCCDFKPRFFSSSMYNILVNLAELAVREIERDVVRKKASALASAAGTTPCLPAAEEAVIMVHATSTKWVLMYANEAWNRMSGVASTEDEEDLWTAFVADPAINLEVIAATVIGGGTGKVRVRQRGPTGAPEGPALEIAFRRAGRDQLGNAVPVGIPSFVPPSFKTEQNGDAPRISFDSLARMTKFDSHLWLGIVAPCENKPGKAPSFARRVTKASTSTVSTAPFAAPKRPRKFKNLHLGALLGHGSYGKVYRGVLMESPVAIKVLDILAADVEGSQRALAEGALSRHLAHPNIVPTLDYVLHTIPEGEGDSQVWIIQHLCDRGSLYDAIEKGWLRVSRTLSAPAALPVVLATAREIASALDYLHTQDIIHGDMSGNNVLLSAHPGSRGFTALVTDFGLSRVLSKDVSTRTVGTVSHMPPELLVDGLLTKAADVYAFGVLLWEMFSGKRAWAGCNMAQIIFQVTIHNQRLAMPSEAPLALCQLVDACTHEDYHARPSFAAVLQQLDEIERGLLNQ